MEEILSSIKRIIAEEGDAATGARTRRAAAAKVAPTPVAQADELDDEEEEVLELSDPAPTPAAQPKAVAPAAAPVEASAAEAPARPEPILSQHVAEATRGPLEALSRMVVKPDVAGSDTLEGLVRELLKPMMREWLDTNLPRIVETMVAREISRITQRQD